MTQNNDEALIEFKDAVKQLCNDFSSLQGNVYIKDVEASLDALCEQFIQSPISQNEQQEAVAFMDEDGEIYALPEQKLLNISIDDLIKSIGKNGVRLYTSPPKQIPDGWKLVPIVLTRKQKLAMISEYEDATGGCRLPDGDGYDEEIVQQMHQAMINASPATSLTSETNTEVGE